jgi:hypothetical protein
MKMETIRFSGTQVTMHRTIQCHIEENLKFNIHYGQYFRADQYVRSCYETLLTSRIKLQWFIGCCPGTKILLAFFRIRCKCISHYFPFLRTLL